MSGPPQEERRSQGDHPETGDVPTTTTTSLPICEMCGGRLGRPRPGRHVCPRCHLDILDGLRRRRDAERRLQPMSDFGWAS